TPMAVRTQTLPASELTITRRRGRRSATTPPTSSVETCASVQHANAMPVSLAEPVRSRTAKATAIGARYVPKYETERAANSSPKLRFLNSTPLLPVALQPGVGLPERHGALVFLETGVHVQTHGLVELLLRYTRLHARDPVVEPPAQLVEVACDVRCHA